MVALLVGLKLSLLRNSLRRSTWRTVGLILGLVYALGVVAAALAGLVGLRVAGVELAGDITVLGFAVVTAGWLVLSLLVFGVDETVDPARFALLPVRARNLLPGLLAAALLGTPGVATVLVAGGLLVTWSRSLPLMLITAVSLGLGVLTCVLLARVGTSALASVLSSRRFRDLTVVVVTVLATALGLSANLVSGITVGDSAALRSALSGAARLAGWTPFGWAWAVPAEAARGQWGSAAAHLLLALGLVAGLWRAWEQLLDRRLTSPWHGGGAPVTVRPGGRIDRLFPASPAGGVAARTLRYWRRDPRYLASALAFLIAPLVVMITPMASGAGGALAPYAPVVLSALLGAGLAADLSYDGSAVWQHVSAGVTGRDDRLGRVLSIGLVYGPVLGVLMGLGLALTSQWHLLPLQLRLTLGVALVGLGVGSVVGALWQWPAPPPGTNPFSSGNSGGLPSLLSFSVASLATAVLSLPVVALAVGAIWVPWLGWLALPVGVGIGVVALVAGITYGGRLLDRRWPEVLAAVGERTG